MLRVTREGPQHNFTVWLRAAMVLTADIILTLLSCLESPAALITWNHQAGSSISASSCVLACLVEGGRGREHLDGNSCSRGGGKKEDTG